MPKDELLTATASIVVAYTHNNFVPQAELPELIQSVQQALMSCETVVTHDGPAKPLTIGEPISRETIDQSIQPGGLRCLECGETFLTLRRHLKSAHGLSEEQYRLRWGLPPDYPMTAPNYSRLRRAIAVAARLGHSRTVRGNGHAE